MAKGSPETSPVTKDHRWPKLPGDQNFTGDQKITGNVAGDQTSLVTKLLVTNYTGDQHGRVTRREGSPGSRDSSPGIFPAE